MRWFKKRKNTEKEWDRFMEIMKTPLKDVNNGTMDVSVLKKYECNNIDEIIEFSHSDKMENTLWRNENE